MTSHFMLNNQTTNNNSSNLPPYIIGKERCDIREYASLCPAPNTPNYLFSKIRNGDIVYESSGVGHIAVVTNTHKKTDNPNDPYYIETIEAVPYGVCYGFLDENRIINNMIKILRPNITDYGMTLMYDKVYNFLEKQIGKDYTYDYIHPHTDINTTSWYCSELAWAAYMNIGLNLTEENGETSPRNLPIPFTIYKSSNVIKISLDTFNDFLNIKTLKKGKNGYRIRIFNFTKDKNCIL